jgi:arylsulfatase A-like enzyme
MFKPNILLIILDSVRAKNTSLLGYQRETTPNLEAFAEDATTYTNARAPGIHSISSHTSIFTGYHVAEHQATSHGASLRPGYTIWEMLSGEGYTTGLFTPNAVVAESSNLATFFHTVEGPKRNLLVFPEALGPGDVPGRPSYPAYMWACLASGSPIKSVVNGLARVLGESSAAHDPKKEHGDEYVQEFLNWMEPAGDPWAACINLMDAHYPYIPLEQFDRWGGKVLQKLHREAMGGPLTTQYLGERPFWELQAFESLYDDCIRQADAYVGRLLERLEAAGGLENTLVVVMSDHGEGFGEYSVLNQDVRLIDHSWGIGDEVSHVPLVVKYPGNAFQRTVRKPASLTKFPSVVEAALNGEQEDFVPQNKMAITTSYRIEEPGSNLPIPDEDKEPYFGPWHAVCRELLGGVVVDAVRREDSARFWPSAPNEALPTYPDRGFVKSTLNNMENEDVIGREGEIDPDVQERLRELGYV